jgi:hypothetical protein
MPFPAGEGKLEKKVYSVQCFMYLPTRTIFAPFLNSEKQELTTEGAPVASNSLPTPAPSIKR